MIECTQITFDFAGYPIIADVYIQPENSHTLILLPALGVSLSKYQNFIHQLTEAKINVIAADYPHCGRNLPTVSASIDYGYADLLNEFIPKLEQIALDHTGQPPILLGHSIGGHLATLYAQTHSISVIGLATGNIGLKYWDIKGKLMILKAVFAINALIMKDGYLQGTKIGFGYKEAKTLMRDWSKTVFSNQYTHILTPASVAQTKSLFIYFEQDHFAPKSSTLALSRYFSQPEIRSLNLTTVVKGNQHSAWTKQPEAVVKMIREWLNSTSF
jgi:predicted alpha/beta hydrolase